MCHLNETIYNKVTMCVYIFTHTSYTLKAINIPKYKLLKIYYGCIICCVNSNKTVNFVSSHLQTGKRTYSTVLFSFNIYSTSYLINTSLALCLILYSI